MSDTDLTAAWAVAQELINAIVKCSGTPGLTLASLRTPSPIIA